MYTISGFGREGQYKLQNKQYTNRLISETTPYLLLHAHNPVQWHPWGDEALDLARKENKLLIISIGYSACHWCHVMEEESFADPAVAAVMNKHFVSIKIDREERPDIDQVYMNAVHLLTRQGGWPLNIIALPDGKPIYGGTYFPKQQWIEIISQVHELYVTEPGKVRDQAASITKGIQSENFLPQTGTAADIRFDDLTIVVNNILENVDFQWGGTTGAPKFPLPVWLRFLLDYSVQTGNQDAMTAVTVTLDRMARGGIYDQIGGGFARYAVDAIWKVPHFEKMLYDNGQLVSLYSFAWQQTKDPLYKKIVYQTGDFIERELLSSEGGFYSSLDADSEGEEGRFYVWSEREVDAVLGKDAELVKKYYSITSPGNWESGKNILFQTLSDDEFSNTNSLSRGTLSEIIQKADAKLFSARETRVRPALDDKILTSWNGLMLRGFVDAYSVFSDPRFLNTALKNAEFLRKNVLKKEHRLDRTYKNGKSTINGFLDDYAILINAFTGLYQVTFDEQWLQEAKSLLEYAITHFKAETSPFFNYKSDIDRDLIAGIIDISDNVIPSPNSIMAENLFLLGHYFSEEQYIRMSTEMAAGLIDQAKKNGTYYANWSRLILKTVTPFYEIAISGDRALQLKKEFDQQFLPGVIFSGSREISSLPLLQDTFRQGSTMIYVCENKTCQQPVDNVEGALQQMGRGRY